MESKVSQNVCIFWILRHSYESGDIPILSQTVCSLSVWISVIVFNLPPLKQCVTKRGPSLSAYSCDKVLIPGGILAAS